MVNSIVKHRRGHIDKWRRSLVVPEDGEIIIVEFDDGSRKCKIGDGKQNFSKLKYVDDATRDELLNEFVELKETVDAKIKSATLKQSVELNRAKEEIVQQVVPVEEKLNRVYAELANTSATFNNRLDDLNTQKAGKAQSDELFDHVADIYDEIADLIDDDVMIINKVFAIENTLTEDIRELRNADSDRLQDLKDKVSALATETETTKILVEAAEVETSERLDAFEQSVDDKLYKLSDSLDIANDKLELTDMRVATQSKRIDNIIALKDAITDGSITTGDMELIDARNVYDETHESVGDAIRAVGDSVITLKNSLSQYIDTQAIDGLRYDYSGDVGLKQPYMLYLTSGGNVVRESGVQIISGSGSGGSGGGGSTVSTLAINAITQSPVICTPKTEVVLEFMFSGTDPSGDSVNQADATWQINGIVVDSTKVNAGKNSFNITKYITANENITEYQVYLTVVDSYGGTQQKKWTVRRTELAIASTFNDKRTYDANETVVFTYIPSGAVEKTAVFKLDDHELDRVPLTSTVAGTSVSYELPAKPHGEYQLEVQLEAYINGVLEKSDSIYKNIKYYDNASTLPIISISLEDPTINPKDFTVKQYSTTNIIYTVYDPSNDAPTVRIEVDGVTVATPTVTENKNFSNTPTGIYSYTAMTAGSHSIKIICGKLEKEVKVYVESIGVEIKPETTGLIFDFEPVGRSNGDANRLWSQNGVHMQVSDNFDWINGGYIPNEEDGPCFCIKAGSSATIDYKLFADDAKVRGKEVKVVFKTKNVSNPDAVFLSCIDNTTTTDHIGFVMGVQAACIYGKNGHLELPYSEEDAIEFEFNISADTETPAMIMGYEDGVPSRPLVYDSTYGFKQNTPKAITLGSPDCDLYIYRFKVYNTSLSNTQILNNFIADARTAEEKLDRYTRNKIYDDDNRLTAESLAAACPWLRVYKLSAPYFTESKDDKVSNTTIQQIYRNGDKLLDNWTAYNAQHSGQGTSSNNYGAAGRNLDFIMNKSDSYFKLGDGKTEASTITLTRESVPVAYLNAKVNIASSNNLTNALLARRYNKYNPYRRPFVRDDTSNIDYIKDTMEFYNCAIFIQETDPDLTKHREFADTAWHFYAIGNIGDSKKTDNTRLTDQNDPYECCVEIMDVDRDLAGFPRDTMINAMRFETDAATNEPIYTLAKAENIDILYEVVGTEYIKTLDTYIVPTKSYFIDNAAGEKVPASASDLKASNLPNLYEIINVYEKTSDSVIDYNKTYYIDILEHDDFSEDYTYGWRYSSNKKDPEITGACKQAWIDFYRFVTTSTREEFKANLKEYFAVDSALYYYLFTTRYCMVDNRAKNTFWHYGKAADGTYKWDLCWDYDNDTALGLDNYGKQVYRYGLEDIDYDSGGTEVFRRCDSSFFCRIRDLFADELKQMYQDLESKAAWKADSFIKECDEWQQQFPEELWRIDIERKYIRTYTSSFINEPGDAQFLTNMANGRMKYHRRQWERNQEIYMASKYQTTAALGGANFANFRVNTFTSPDTLVVPPNYQFTLTPYLYMYLNVQYGGKTPISVRAVPNIPTAVPYSSKEADIINVGSAAAIRDFGDLSALYPDTVSVQYASRLRTLKIGNSTPGYKNTSFSSYDIGKNELLEQLDLTNLINYNKTLDLSELINLSKLYAFGTKVPGVLFAEGGKISYAELPAVNSLTLRNLSYLNELKLESYGNVVDLTVEGCKLIDQLSLFEMCPNLNNVKLDNINFGTKTYKYFEDNVFKISNASFAGTVHISTLNGRQFNELKTRYPKLKVTYDSLTSHIKFINTDLETIIYEQDIKNAGDCIDLTTTDGWVEPTKDATQEFTYKWFGWAEEPNTIVNYELLSSAEAAEQEEMDCIKYRVDAINHVEGDRTLYPVFKVTRNGYTVTFRNPTDNNRILYEVTVLYGDDGDYVGPTPKKLDAASPDLYSFVSWYPSPDNITGDTICDAQFVLLNNIWYTIGLSDITYALDKSAKTLSILSWDNRLTENNIRAIKIPASFNISGTNYTVASIKGFANYKALELIELPSSTRSILASAFSGCDNLFSILIPEGVESIGSNAFAKCVSIAELNLPASLKNIDDKAFLECTGLISLTVDEDNTVYKVISDCLINTKTGALVLGLSTGVIPQDGTVQSLQQYCFNNTKVTSVQIPEGVTSIPSNAFSYCRQLEQVELPNTLTKLGATCFMNCTKLTSIQLPNSLKEILTFVFKGCSFTNVVIPASVDRICENAFGGQSTLKTVTFEEKIVNGSIVAPNMDPQAFANADSNEIIFNVPWAPGYPYRDADGYLLETDPTGWGAKHFKINYYNHKEVE